MRLRGRRSAQGHSRMASSTDVMLARSSILKRVDRCPSLMRRIFPIRASRQMVRLLVFRISDASLADTNWGRELFRAWRSGSGFSQTRRTAPFWDSERLGSASMMALMALYVAGFIALHTPLMLIFANVFQQTRFNSDTLGADS